MIVDFEFMQFENNRIRKEVCTQGQPLGISHPCREKRGGRCRKDFPREILGTGLRCIVGDQTGLRFPPSMPQLLAFHHLLFQKCLGIVQVSFIVREVIEAKLQHLSKVLAILAARLAVLVCPLNARCRARLTDPGFAIEIAIPHPPDRGPMHLIAVHP